MATHILGRCRGNYDISHVFKIIPVLYLLNTVLFAVNYQRLSSQLNAWQAQPPTCAIAVALEVLSYT